MGKEKERKEDGRAEEKESPDPYSGFRQRLQTSSFGKLVHTQLLWFVSFIV